MKFLLFFCVLIFISFTRAFAFDVTLLQNNKESFSRVVTKQDRADLEDWKTHHRLGDGLKPAAVQVFRSTMLAFAGRSAQCDMGLTALLLENATAAGVITGNDELRALLVFLRTENEMDDILMNIVLKGNEIANDLADAGKWRKPKVPRGLLPAPDKLDLKRFFSMVSPWPDEVNTCAIGRYFRMAEMLTYKSTDERNKIMWRVANIGLRDGLIDTETFYKLEALRTNAVLDLNSYAYNYFTMVDTAKDKLSKTRELTSTNDMGTKYVSRKESLTQRGRLYKVFSPSQVMIMAGVIEKLSKRMDARRVELVFQYGQEPGTNDSQIYVLSPMEQYRVSIKMMKKEMAELMRGDLFRNTGITYEDIIASSYETGLLKSSELDQILKFEEFWNPKAPSRFRTYAQFAFNIAGTASFYLPPPWNLMGAVALMFTQSRLMPSQDKPDPDDNWNVII